VILSFGWLVILDLVNPIEESRRLARASLVPAEPRSTFSAMWTFSVLSVPSVASVLKPALPVPSRSLPVHYRFRTCISINVHAGPYRSYRSSPPKGGGGCRRFLLVLVLVLELFGGRAPRVEHALPLMAGAG